MIPFTGSCRNGDDCPFLHEVRSENTRPKETKKASAIVSAPTTAGTTVVVPTAADFVAPDATTTPPRNKARRNKKVVAVNGTDDDNVAGLTKNVRNISLTVAATPESSSKKPSTAEKNTKKPETAVQSEQAPAKLLNVYCGGGNCGYSIDYQLSGNDISAKYCCGKNTPDRTSHQLKWGDAVCVKCRGQITTEQLPGTLEKSRCPNCQKKLHSGVISKFGLVVQ